MSEFQFSENVRLSEVTSGTSSMMAGINARRIFMDKTWEDEASLREQSEKRDASTWAM